MNKLFILSTLIVTIVGCKVEQQATEFNTLEEKTLIARVDSPGDLKVGCGQFDDASSCQEQQGCQALVSESEKFLSCFESPIALNLPEPEIGVVEVQDDEVPTIVEEKEEEDQLVEDIDLETDYSCGKNKSKVIVCHVPKGNPENIHSICISVNAWESAHMHKHSGGGVSDHLGACTLREVEKLR